MSVSAAANQAPTAANPGVGELFRTVGAEIHRRLAEVAGGDEARTRADAQVLFVRFYLRFVIRRAADARDAGARLPWIARGGGWEPRLRPTWPRVQRAARPSSWRRARQRPSHRR